MATAATLPASAVINGLLSLSVGVIALILQMVAFGRELRYQVGNFLMVDGLRQGNHSVYNPEFALLTHYDAVEYYYSDYYRNFWDEPLSMAFNLVALILALRHFYWFAKRPVVAKSVFLFGVTYVVKILLLLMSAYLLFKSYISIENGYLQSFIKGSKLEAWTDLFEDGYMRLSCYDGYFNTLVNYDEVITHYDEETFKRIVHRTRTFRVENNICQSSGLKIWAVTLLVASSLFAALAICCSVCCDTSVQNVININNKISPKENVVKGPSQPNKNFARHSKATDCEFQHYSNPWSDKSLNVSKSTAFDAPVKEENGHRHHQNNPRDQLKSIPYTPSFPHVANQYGS